MLTGLDAIRFELVTSNRMVLLVVLVVFAWFVVLDWIELWLNARRISKSKPVRVLSDIVLRTALRRSAIKS